MARCNLTLKVTPTPALDALITTAHAIAEREGEDLAIAWCERVMAEDFELFYRLSTNDRPALRLIQGGR